MRAYDLSEEIENYAGMNVVGVTEITDCPRRAYWKRKEAIEPLTWDSFVRIHTGSAWHQSLEPFARPAIMWAELPIGLSINDRWVLVGVIDAYDPLRGELWEIKTTGWQNYANNRLPFEEHIRQAGIYTWMLHQAGVYPKRVRIFYLFREARRNGKQWVDYDVPLDDLEKEYHYIDAFIDALEEALESDDPSTLPLLPEDKRFKCERCAWRNKCLPRKEGQVTLEVSTDERI